MKKRLIILALGLVVVVSNIITIFPVSQTARAISPEDIAKNTEQYSYYTALKNCAEDGKVILRVQASGSTDSWMKSGDVVVGFSVPNDKGKSNCKEVLGLTMSSFGYGGNPTGFLKDFFGFSETSPGVWSQDMTDNMDTGDRFTKEAKARGIPTGETNAITYKLSTDALLSGSGCAAKQDDSGVAITVVTDTSGGTKAVKYKFDGNEKRDAYPRASPSESSSVSCSGIADSLNKAATGLKKDMADDAYKHMSKTYEDAVAKKLCDDLLNGPMAGNYGDCVTSVTGHVKSCVLKAYNKANSVDIDLDATATCIAGLTGAKKATILLVLNESKEAATASNPIELADPPGGTTNTDPVCSAGQLGWIICPMIAVMQTAIETIAKFMDSLLRLNPLDRTTGGGSIYDLWRSILNVANIALVIAFLIVIFSQATSVGLSSYGIKKMLPRIIAAAILMNLSFFICQVLVDFSNILGAGTAQLVQSATKGASFSTAVTEHVTGVEKIVAGSVTVAIIIFFFLIPVLLSFLAVFFTIAARFALVILLILVAPLAFAAWILPNTEKYFQKWWGLFFNLLMLYPIVMLLFAAAIIASKAVGSI